MPVTEGFVCWTQPIGTVGPCQYITNRLGCIDIAARAGSITKPADADIAQGNLLGTYDGINTYIYTVCPQVPAIPTTTTTVAPITLTLTASCIGSGVNGTGRIVANGFGGGTGTFANIKIGNSLSNAAAATPVVLSGATSYTWNNLVNSTWFVILTDNAGNSNYAQVTVSCTNTTTTTSTTTTTTAAPICTFNGGSAVVIYPTTTTTTSTSTTSTSTTSTTTTTTAAPQCTYDGFTIVCEGETTTTTTTTAAPGGSFTVKNTSGSGEISNVSGDGGVQFYFLAAGSYPLIAGQQIDGGGASRTNDNIFVDITNFLGIGTSCLSLYINGGLNGQLQVTANGTYQFGNKTFTSSDVVLIEYVSGTCA
jgi:hypothetical protein